MQSDTAPPVIKKSITVIKKNMSTNKKSYFPQFGDIVKFRGKQWFFLGMDEDGALNMVRSEDEHAFNCVEFQQAWHDEWGEIELVSKSVYGKDSITPDHIPWKPSKYQSEYRRIQAANASLSSQEIFDMMIKKIDG